MTDLDPIALRRIMSRFATGVAVVATKHGGGVSHVYHSEQAQAADRAVLDFLREVDET
jgi:flavin reductase (DIM6/NTAB) family NADH-FMN oxidoreductase RutF